MNKEVRVPAVARIGLGPLESRARELSVGSTPSGRPPSRESKQAGYATEGGTRQAGSYHACHQIMHEPCAGLAR